MDELLQRIKVDRQKLKCTAKKDQLTTLRYNLLTTLVGESETALKGKQAAKFDMLTLVKKFYSNVEDTLAIKFTETGRRELCILNEYIPAQLTEEDFKSIILFELDCQCKSIGQFMGYMNKNYKGEFDGKKASDTFKAFAGDRDNQMKGG
jgi:uncharacterized protein YqeY